LSVNTRCLIIGPSWVGDMIMAHSLFQRLALQTPGIIIDVLAPAWSLGILARMPEIRRAIASPFAHGRFDWAGRCRLGGELRREAYDMAIVLPNSWKSALLPFFARIPIRRGYVGECRYGLLNQTLHLNQQAMPRLVDRYGALASFRQQPDNVLPPPRLSVHPSAQQASLAHLQLTLDRPVLVLCPGAEFGNAKRWPERHYATIANAKLAEGWQIWLLGSAKDSQTTDAINHLTGNRCANLAGSTSLEQTVDLIACANAVVTNDSGLMHVAAAVNVPVLAIYGSTDPGYTPPLSAQARILRLGLECSPCFKRECPLGHLNCLNHLEPEMVLSALPDHPILTPVPGNH
jgi:heptosyltransferase II